MAQDTLEPTLRGRVSLAIFYAAGLGWYLSYKFLLHPVTKDIARMEYCDSVPWVRGEIAYFSILALLISGLFLFQGYRTLKLRQWPLPNTPVWRSTPIQRGFVVLLRGGILVLIGMAIPIAMIAWALLWPPAIALLFGSGAEIGCA